MCVSHACKFSWSNDIRGYVWEKEKKTDATKRLFLEALILFFAHILPHMSFHHEILDTCETHINVCFKKFTISDFIVPKGAC